MKNAAACFRRLAFTLVLLGWVAGCSRPSANYPYNKEPDPRGREFELGVSDQIRVTVWRHPELSSDFEIPEEGIIKMPLIGSFQAQGRTVSQIRRELQERLRTFVKDEAAQVTVAVTRLSSYRFTVSGQVNRPNLYAPSSYVTVTEGLALAGGLTRFADRGGIYILRPHGDTRRKIPIDYDAIMNEGRSDMNIVLLTGDTLHVP